MSLMKNTASIERTRRSAGRLARGGQHRRHRRDRAALLPREHHREGGGMRPYSPLELAGRNIYIREGCYVCHSQMIRPIRDEVERYGHYSLAAESMYDHPFQWGSKRTGPDLARVGGRYSNEWHVEHLIDPRSVVPESIMPSYAFLATTPLKVANVTADLTVQCACGCALHRRHDRQRRGRPDGAGRSRCGYVGDRGALSEGQARRFRRQSGSGHRDGCARVLSADARHAGRFLEASGYR
jgi:hypothetical protein